MQWQQWFKTQLWFVVHFPPIGMDAAADASGATIEVIVANPPTMARLRMSARREVRSV